MNIILKKAGLLTLVLFLFSWSVYSQLLQSIVITHTQGLNMDQVVLSDNDTVTLIRSRPLFSFLLNNKLYKSGVNEVVSDLDNYSQIFDDIIKVTCSFPFKADQGLKGDIVFENIGTDTITISNIVPFSQDESSVYITGKGPWDLARAYLFRPGLKPLRVILPDNAWELGYSSFYAGDGYSLCAIARRTNVESGQRQRYDTRLAPGGKVFYTVHADLFKGEWQNGLRIMFRDRYLYDIEKFDNSLYEREDLAWIKKSYLIILQMAWDREFYDRFTGKYRYADVIRNGNGLFGKIDVYGLWPTWPRLGLDQRNQWDLYRDLPGGTEQLRNFVRMSKLSDTRFFIAYNPWDNSTRQEDHFSGMSQLIAETEADGVVLDTRGSSSFELQAAADAVRKGVVMYSEGMAIPKDMPGIISGRVHNAIFYSPELNLNKLIKPDFSIFRVCDVGEDILHREIAIAFFNGYGTELNMFRPGGRGDEYRDDLSFLSRTTFILRQNNDAFLDYNWTPLIETTLDNVYVNRWKSGAKTIYTVLNMKPEGINRKLFKVGSIEGKHYVSLWNHENLSPVRENGLTYISSNAEGWHSAYSGTRKEGSVDCIAEFPEIISSELIGDSLEISCAHKGSMVIWKGDPSYQTLFKELSVSNDTTINIEDIFGFYEGKIVIQLIDDNVLIDENVLTLKGGKPWIISKVLPTIKASAILSDMVLVPGSLFSFNVSSGDDFIPYPELNMDTVKIDSFLIDKYPVTNAQYYDFIVNSGYKPSDTTRYLRHWQNSMYKQGQDNYPVVYISYEDIKAYTKWAGKRLPTQAEWQLAAQGTDKRNWPWGNEFHGTYCNNSFNRPTPVDAFSKGQSPYGVMDMVGNVWQMTNDMYFNGTNYYVIIRGGSYYNPESSWWYIKGGPQSLDKTQMLLLVSPGFDRSSTVGFRCVMDVDSKVLKEKQKGRSK